MAFLGDFSPRHTSQSTCNSFQTFLKLRQSINTLDCQLLKPSDPVPAARGLSPSLPPSNCLPTTGALRPRKARYRRRRRRKRSGTAPPFAPGPRSFPARFSAMLDPLAAGKGSEGFRSWQSSVLIDWRSLGKVWKLLQVLWLVCRGLKSPRKAMSVQGLFPGTF